MYWKLLLLLGVCNEVTAVSLTSTPLPEMVVPINDLRVCYENIANPTMTGPKICHNFTDFRAQITKYTTAFAAAHNDTKQEQNKENIDLMEYATNSENYTYVYQNMECMNLTLAVINCSINLIPESEKNSTNSRESLLDKHKLHRLLFAKGFEYTTTSCGIANETKICVIKTGLKECNDVVKQWTADIFDYSIKKCLNETAISPNSATEKYPLPLLMAFLVMTAASVSALSPTSD